MGAFKLKYLTDEQGKKIAVVISIKEYEALLEAMEELEDIKDFDEYKSKNEPTVSLEEAIKYRKNNNG